MPYETVQEKVVRTKRVRVCARCRCRLPSTTGDRQTMNTVGGVGGSLGASLGGSILLGSVLGPVGAIGGAIAGSLAGARAGRTASDKLADAVESSRATANDLCESCQSLGTNSSSNNGGGSGQVLGGGQRLGSGEPIQQQTAQATPGEKIGEAASAAGRSINNGLSWMKQSVTQSFAASGNSNNSSNNCSGNPPTGWGGSSGNQTSEVL